MHLQKAATTTSGNQLPAAFHYQISELIGIITGEWIDSSSATSLQLFADSSKEISYNSSVPNALCGPTQCSIPVTGIYSSSTKSKIMGSVTFYSTIDSGEVELTIVQTAYFGTIKKMANSCTMAFRNFLLQKDRSFIKPTFRN